MDEMTNLMPPPPPAPAASSSSAFAVVDVTSLDDEDGATSDIVETLSKRLAVDIVMKLPVVVVPVSLQSTTAIIVDLGGLSIANELRVVPDVRSEENFPAVIDWTNCHWSNVNIAR